MQPHPRPRIPLILPTLILLLAAGLRIATLGLNSVWWDEGFSVWVFRQPIPELIHQAALDTHPPTYYLSAHLWMMLAGSSPTALRVPSALWGLLAVALVMRAGLMLGGRRGSLAAGLVAGLPGAARHNPDQSVAGYAGLIAGLLAGMVPLWVQWSQEIRMYAQATAFAALALLAALKLIDPRTRHPWRWAALLALGEGGGLLSLFLVAGLIIALNAGGLVAFITRKDRWKFAVQWGAAQAVALAMFLPWYIFSSSQSAWQAAYPAIDLWFTLRLYVGIFLVGVSENIDQFGPLIALAAIILLAAIYFAWREAASPPPALHAGSSSPQVERGMGGEAGPAIPRFCLLLFGVILPPLLLYVLFLLPRSERFNIASPDGRHFLVMSAPIYLMVGWGLAVMARRFRPAAWLAVAALAGMLGWSLLARYYPSRLYVDDYATLGAALQAMVRPGDTVLLDNDYEWPVFAYHYPAGYVPIPQGRVLTRRAAHDLVDSAVSGRAGVWLVETPFAAESDPNGFIPSVLAAHAARIDTYHFPMADLVFYALTPGRAAASAPSGSTRWPDGFQPAAMPIAAGASLAGYTSPDQPISAGTTIGIGLGWHVGQGSGQWPVALRLVGADGSEIASTDITLSSPSPGDYFQPATLFIPTFGPTGPAQIVLVAGPSSTTLGRLVIQPTHAALPPEATVPATAKTLGVRFGPHIRLVAAELPAASWSPGQTIPLTLYWATDAPLAVRYKAFAHLVGISPNPRLGNTLWGQDDHEPGGGFAPTILWRPGAIIRDDFAVPILPHAAAGTYQLEVGLYEPLGLLDLPVSGADGAPLGGAYPIMTVTIVR